MEDWKKKYEDLARRLKKYHSVIQDGRSYTSNDIKDAFEDILPDLKVSEDVKIKEDILYILSNTDLSSVSTKFSDMVNWLDKHSKSLMDHDDEIMIKHLTDFFKTAKGLEGTRETFLKWIKDLKEKLSGCPAQNKQQYMPMYKIGDFVIGDYAAGKIIEITDDAYLLDTEQGIPFSSEHNIHLWTIEDAKPGDVLAYPDGTLTLFNKIVEDGLYLAYAIVSHKIENNNVELNNTCCVLNAIPATKLQCETLFRKLKEAEYEWDVEKLEVRKISQTSESNKWTSDDEKNATYICAALEAYYRLRKDNGNDSGQKELDGAKTWLYERLRNVPQSSKDPLSEEDKISIGYLCSFIEDKGKEFYGKNLSNVISWIKRSLIHDKHSIEIPFRKLTSMFPKDTMWVDGCAEIIGYSPKQNLHIVISDGQCVTDDGKYLVHKYAPENPEEHLKNWNSGKYPYKYLEPETKISEEWVDFSDKTEETK